MNPSLYYSNFGTPKGTIKEFEKHRRYSSNRDIKKNDNSNNLNDNKFTQSEANFLLSPFIDPPVAWASQSEINDKSKINNNNYDNTINISYNNKNSGDAVGENVYSDCTAVLTTYESSAKYFNVPFASSFIKRRNDYKDDNKVKNDNLSFSNGAISPIMPIRGNSSQPQKQKRHKRSLSLGGISSGASLNSNNKNINYYNFDSERLAICHSILSDEEKRVQWFKKKPILNTSKINLNRSRDNCRIDKAEINKDDINNSSYSINNSDFFKGMSKFLQKEEFNKNALYADNNDSSCFKSSISSSLDPIMRSSLTSDCKQVNDEENICGNIKTNSVINNSKKGVDKFVSNDIIKDDRFESFVSLEKFQNLLFKLEEAQKLLNRYKRIAELQYYNIEKVLQSSSSTEFLLVPKDMIDELIRDRNLINKLLLEAKKVEEKK